MLYFKTLLFWSENYIIMPKQILKIRGILLNDLYRICNWSVIQIKFCHKFSCTYSF